VALASGRKAHTEAQAAAASGCAPHQALLLDRAAVVREIVCLGSRVVDHDMVPGKMGRRRDGDHPMV
jgi:hypothetical protein